jgi:hypothetical protein
MMHPVALADTTASDQLSALSDLACEIRALVRVTGIAIIEIGQKLIAAKAQVQHGEWLSWLDCEFDWSEQTARRFMQVAEAFKSLTVSDLNGLTIDASALYKLASAKVPEDVRGRAIEAAKDGTHITKDYARRLIEAPKPAPDEDTDTDVVEAVEDVEPNATDTTEDDDEADQDDDATVPERLPIPNDDNWEESVRDWIDARRDQPILLRDVIDRFAEAIPLHRASRRWHFDFIEFRSAYRMRQYALLISLRSLGVKFSPQLGRGLNPAPETQFTVPPRRRGGW